MALSNFPLEVKYHILRQLTFNKIYFINDDFFWQMYANYHKLRIFIEVSIKISCFLNFLQINELVPLTVLKCNKISIMKFTKVHFCVMAKWRIISKQKYLHVYKFEDGIAIFRGTKKIPYLTKPIEFRIFEKNQKPNRYINSCFTCRSNLLNEIFQPNNTKLQTHLTLATKKFLQCPSKYKLDCKTYFQTNIIHKKTLKNIGIIFRDVKLFNGLTSLNKNIIILK